MLVASTKEALLGRYIVKMTARYQPSMKTSNKQLLYGVMQMITKGRGGGVVTMLSVGWAVIVNKSIWLS